MLIERSRRIPEKHHRTLDLYKQGLPSNEYAALHAWLTTFYPFQLDWLLEPSQLAVCNGSRQTGKSHTTAAVGVLWGAFHGELTTIVSIGQQESDEVLLKAKQHRQLLNELGSRMATSGGLDRASGINFESGGRILALPSSGGRGFTGNVFLDEYAYQQHADKVWDAAIAVTMHGYKARVASTPNGIGNAFEQLWSNPEMNKGWSKHEISIHRAISDGMKVELDHCWSIAKGDPRLFAQLFECSFLDGALQYIPTRYVDGCIYDGPKVPTTGHAFAGLDIGKSIDRTELYVVQYGVDGHLHVVHRDSCKRTEQEDLDRMVATAFKRHDIRKLCVDATGMGSFPAEAMQKKYGRARVEPVMFTLQSKDFLASILYLAFAESKLRIPKEDEQLRTDVCSIQRIVSDAGNIKYEAPRTDAGHADKAWSLALALKAAGLMPSSQAAHSGMV